MFEHLEACCCWYSLLTLQSQVFASEAVSSIWPDKISSWSLDCWLLPFSRKSAAGCPFLGSCRWCAGRESTCRWCVTFCWKVVVGTALTSLFTPLATMLGVASAKAGATHISISQDYNIFNIPGPDPKFRFCRLPHYMHKPTLTNDSHLALPRWHNQYGSDWESLTIWNTSCRLLDCDCNTEDLEC